MTLLSKNIFGLLAAVMIPLTFFLPGICIAEPIPGPEQIEEVITQSSETFEQFMRESFYLRMGYMYRGKFTSAEDRRSLCEMAQQAFISLADLQSLQVKYKAIIEDYSGEDWDQRFGDTGLWRKLSGGVYAAALARCKVVLWVVLCDDNTAENKLLVRNLDQIDSLEITPASRLLKVKTLGLMDASHADAARKQLDDLLAVGTVPEAVRFAAIIERVRRRGLADASEAPMLIESLAQSSCGGDFELILAMTFACGKYERDIFRMTANIWPQTEDLLGSLIIEDLNGGLIDLEKLSVFEAELAAMSGWKNRAVAAGDIITRMVDIEKFQTSVIFYSGAALFAESNPKRAVSLLVGASKVHKQSDSKRLGLTAGEIAWQGASLAYKVFAADANESGFALQAFENYRSVVKQSRDIELEYLYSIVLRKDGSFNKARRVLADIAAAGQGYWNNRARFDLIEMSRRQWQTDRDETIEQLESILPLCSTQGSDEQVLHDHVMLLYCDLLLEKHQSAGAEKVLNILSKQPDQADVNLIVFKVRAYQQLKMLIEAGESLASISDEKHCSEAGLVFEVLNLMTDNIEQSLTDVKDRDELLKCWEKVGRFCFGCLNAPEKNQAAVLLAEILILRGSDTSGEVEILLDPSDGAENVDILRCRARLLVRNGKNREAAVIWSQICKIRAAENAQNSNKGWKWWRAKYYELQCWSLCGQSERASAAHTIEVLKSGYAQIPSPWFENISLLGEQCGAQAGK